MGLKLKKSMITIILLASLSALILYCFYYTRSVTLQEILGRQSFTRIEVYHNSFVEKLPANVKAEDASLISEVINILDSYKFNKLLQFSYSETVLANPSEGVIHLFCINSDETIIFSVDAENDIAVGRNNKYSYYKIGDLNQNLYSELANWVKQMRDK